jgi:hypothetical protein
MTDNFNIPGLRSTSPLGFLDYIASAMPGPIVEDSVIEFT